MSTSSFQDAPGYTVNWMQGGLQGSEGKSSDHESLFIEDTVLSWVLGAETWCREGKGESAESPLKPARKSPVCSSLRLPSWHSFHPPRTLLQNPQVSLDPWFKRPWQRVCQPPKHILQTPFPFLQVSQHSEPLTALGDSEEPLQLA